MALGFDVMVIGVHSLGYKELVLPAWRRDPTYFDGWALARDPRIRKVDADQLTGVFTPAEARELNARFAKRVMPDGSITPTEMDAKIISLDDDSFIAPDKPPPPSVEELTQLLAEPRLKWVIIHLWDIS